MNKKTSKSMASKAGDILQDDNSSKIQKTLAASVLAQANSNKATGKEMESKAAKVLNSVKYNDETKSLAASLVSQSIKNR